MKTLELKNYGVHELNDHELKETNGGGPEVVPILIAFLVGAVTSGLTWDAIKEGAFGISDDIAERAADDDYVIWADVGHR